VRTRRLRMISSRLLAIGILSGCASAAIGQTVIHVAIEDAITPVTARHLVEAIRRGELERARAVLVQIDTPGGLDASMREATKAILASTVPVVVWVGPPGARAASAGMFITLAAHIAAMAPGTNIGAAHPVGIGGGQIDSTMAAKVVNDAVAYARSIATARRRNADWAEQAVRASVSLEAQQAVREGVCDLIAEDLSSLLRQIDGRVVQTSAGSDTLRTEGVRVLEIRMSFREKVLAALANPNIAYLLFLAGILGIFFELSNPGVILPGVIGGISLILALFAFQALSVNYAGLLLVLLAVIMFLAEIKVPSHGALAIGGVISMLLGSLMLFRGRIGEPRLSIFVIAPALLITAGFFIFAVGKALQAQRRQPVTGREGMLGEVATVIEDLRPDGKVFVDGEAWLASSSSSSLIRKGQKVRIVSVEGLRLRVTPVDEGLLPREG